MVKYRKIPKLTEKQLAKYWQRVDKQGANDCWPWLGHTDKDGYGRVSLNSSQWLAPRIAVSLVNKMPCNLQIRHLCNNPICVNPKHLIPGTSKEDCEDRRRAGTMLLGEKSPKSKLTDKDIREILRLNKIINIKNIAALYKVSPNTINSILLNKTWKHIPRPKRIHKHPHRARGKQNGKSVFTEKDVLQVIALRKQGKSYKEIATIIHHNVRSLGAILFGQSWAWLTGIKRKT